MATNNFGRTAFSPTDPITVSAVAIDPASGLVGHWTRNDSAAAGPGLRSSATDSSGHGNHGSLVNGPVWTTSRLASGLRLQSWRLKLDSPQPLLSFQARSNLTYNRSAR